MMRVVGTKGKISRDLLRNASDLVGEWVGQWGGAHYSDGDHPLDGPFLTKHTSMMPLGKIEKIIGTTIVTRDVYDRLKAYPEAHTEGIWLLKVVEV